MKSRISCQKCNDQRVKIKWCINVSNGTLSKEQAVVKLSQELQEMLLQVSVCQLVSNGYPFPLR